MIKLPPRRQRARARYVFLLAIFGAATLASGAARSSETPAEAVSDSIAEIIVTAQKREERLQDVPISIVAVSARTLEEASVRDIKDLPRLVPNFAIQRAAQTTGIRLAVRGIGTFGNSAVEPSVAPFLDGIYMPRSGLVFASFLDIDTIEVLRGPQGTMFGRNASMGALLLRSAEPRNAFEGMIKAEAASGDRQRLEAVANVPLSESVAVRAAGLGQGFGGYWHNAGGGANLTKLDQLTGRVSVKAALSDSLAWTVRVEGADFSGAEYPNLKLDYGSVGANGLAGLTRLLGANIPDPDLYNRRNNVFYPPNAGNRDKQWAVSSALEWTPSSGYEFKLLDGYRNWRNRSVDGGTAFLPVPTVERDAYFTSASQSHELQVSTPQRALLGGRFDAVGGVYYFRERYGVGETNIGLDDYCPLVVANLAPAQAPPCAAAVLTVGRFAQTTESVALYTEGHTAVMPGLELITGVRWTDERKRGGFVQTVPNPAGALLRGAEDTALRFDGSRVNWRAGLNWRPTEEAMVFVAASTGYKSGGFNSSGSGVALGGRRIYGPETTTDYEFGAKTGWLDHRLVLDLTVYRVDIDGYQDRSFDGLGFVVRNVGSLRHQGLELETQAEVRAGLRLNLGLAYLDSRFTSFRDAANLPGLPGTQDLTGGSAHYAPKWSGSAGVQVAGESFSLPWTLRTDVAFQSRSNIGASTDNNPQTLEPGYAVLSARLTIHSPGDTWLFALFGENLTDTSYSTNAFYQTFDTIFGLRRPGATALRQTPGNPRAYGLSITRQF